ncbi:MAG: hypothetical protein AAFO07_08880 [Bacteroidota bacterium]
MNSNLYYSIIAVVVVILVVLTQFSSVFSKNTKDVPPAELAAIDRWTLYNNMRSHGKMLLIYPHTDAENLSIYESISKNVVRQRRASIDVELVSDQEVTKEQLSTNPICIIGSLQENELLKEKVDFCYIHAKEKGFSFDNKNYNLPNDLIKINLFPSPYNKDFPVFILTGNDGNHLLEYLQNRGNSSLFRSSWNYEIIKKDKAVVFGNFNEFDWGLDKNVHFDFTESAFNKANTKHLKFINYNKEMPDTTFNNLTEAAEASIQKVLDFVGKPDEEVILPYYIYPSVENKGLQEKDNSQSHCDFRRSCVHVVSNHRFSGHQWHPENEVILRKLLSQPKVHALERGLSLYFTSQWQEKGYAYWATLMHQTDNLPPLQEVLNNEWFQKESELVMSAAAASFVAFLIDYWGKEKFLAEYMVWSPNEKEIKNLSKKWLKSLDEAAVPTTAKRMIELPYLKGFNFAHEGYSIYNGYGSKLATQSLSRMKKINSNAAAIVPYSYMGNPHKPSFIPIADNAGSENDEACIYAHLEAKAMGMYTLMKPQIWFGRGSWPGDVKMNSEEDWKLFFNYYYRWMRHYAILSEMYQLDGLSVGVEFAKATVERPEDWKEIISKLRGLFSGHITYCANWGPEFENLVFWEELDYIGLNCYYPLSKSEQASKEEMAANFKKTIDMVEGIVHKYQRPLVFTEIGFRSVDRTWVNPHEEANNRDFNADTQQVCYEIVFEEIKDREWCNGILWWKWPSYLSGRRRENTGFTPFNKTAEQTVEKWFSQL